MKFSRRPSRASREPLWREEISIFSAEERYVNRRQFAKFLVLTSLGMFVGNLGSWSGAGSRENLSIRCGRWRGWRRSRWAGSSSSAIPAPRTPAS